MKQWRLRSSLHRRLVSVSGWKRKHRLRRNIPGAVIGRCCIDARNGLTAVVGDDTMALTCAAVEKKPEQLEAVQNTAVKRQVNPSAALSLPHRPSRPFKLSVSSARLVDGMPFASSIVAAVADRLHSLVDEIAKRMEGHRRGKQQKQQLRPLASVRTYFDPQTNGLYPCTIIGLGPSSTAERATCVVRLIGYSDSCFEVVNMSRLGYATAEVQQQVLLDIHFPPELTAAAQMSPYLPEHCHQCLNAALFPAYPDVDLTKYWEQRYRLFSLFDRGIRLDREAWFSVTPELISLHIAKTCVLHAKRNGLKLALAVDCFCGSGGNTIALARLVNRVLAVDIRAEAISDLMHNASIYGVNGCIEPIVGDFYSIMSHKRFESADVMLLAPPWGGVSYADEGSFNMRTMMGSGDGVDLAMRVSRLCDNIVYMLPRNTPLRDIAEMAQLAGRCWRLENAMINGKIKMMVLYMGPMFA